MILALAVPAKAQSESDPNCYFSWVGAKCRPVSEGGNVNEGVTGGTIQLSASNLYTSKKAGDETYNVIKLDELVKDRYFKITLNNPIESGDTLYVKGFWHFEADANDTDNGIKPLIAKINGKKYELNGFENLHSQADKTPGFSKIILDGSIAGAKEITFEMVGTTKTLYVMEVSLCHNPNYLKFLSVSPEPGSRREAFESDEESNIVVTTNIPVDEILMTLSDETVNKELLTGAAFTCAAEESTGSGYVNWYEFQEPILLYEGHTYVMTLTAYSDGEQIGDKYTVKYYGDLPEPYSNVKLTSQTPAENDLITSAEENVIRLTFSGSATIEKVEALFGDSQIKECSFTSSQSPAAEWNVTVPSEIINDYLGFTLHVYAKDENGRQIITDETTPYSIATFTCNVPKAIAVSPAGNQEFDDLTSFDLSYTDGIELANKELKVTLQKDGSLYSEGTLEKVDDHYKFTLASPVSKAGTYTLVIPEGMFKLGIGFNNQLMEVEYTIKQKEYEATITWFGIDGESNPLTSLEAFEIDFTKGGYKAGYCDKNSLNRFPIMLYNEANEEVAKVLTVDVIEGKPEFKCTFNKAIYTSGNYFLQIPANIFVLAKDLNNLTYLLNEEMYFEVTVEKTAEPEKQFGPITITPANGSTVKSLSRVVIRFEDAFSTTVDTANHFEVKEIKVNKAEDGSETEIEAETKYYASLTKYTLGGQDLDGRLNFSLVFETKNEANGTYSPTAITTVGTYRTIVPSGSILVKYLSGLSLDYDRDWTFEYTVDPNFDGIETIFAPVDPSELDPATIVKVYNLQGIMVRQGRLDEVLNGLQGLFIVNGHKMFLK